MPFGRKAAAPKEEKKKSGFGLGSLMKNALGGKTPSTFPPTEVYSLYLFILSIGN